VSENPICIGQPTIETLARNGMVQFAGISLIAADGLYGADPYAKIAALEAELATRRHPQLLARIDTLTGELALVYEQLAAEKAAREAVEKERDEWHRTSDAMADQAAELRADRDRLRAWFSVHVGHDNFWCDKCGYSGPDVNHAGCNYDAGCSACLDKWATEYRLRARCEALLGNGTPWPLRQVLAKLIQAARILLDEKDYDKHGWELIAHAITHAQRYCALAEPDAGAKEKTK
jgi:hypothetical protein